MKYKLGIIKPYLTVGFIQKNLSPTQPPLPPTTLVPIPHHPALLWCYYRNYSQYCFAVADKNPTFNNLTMVSLRRGSEAIKQQALSKSVLRVKEPKLSKLNWRRQNQRTRGLERSHWLLKQLKQMCVQPPNPYVNIGPLLDKPVLSCFL